MNLKEVFAQVGIQTDELARRVTNVSSAMANISAEEIEAGVTLERLATIGVPVFRYQTQITIHGDLPDFDPAARPGGYKSIVRNGNGSIGVRYVAVDAAKKETLVSASRYGHGGYVCSLSSTGLTVFRSFQEKEACLDAYRNFPRNLFHGSLLCGASAYGGFYLVAYVGAIPSESLWSFVTYLTGVTSPEDLDARISAREAEHAAAKAASEANLARIKSEHEEAKQKVAASISLTRLDSLPDKGFFVGIGIRSLTNKAEPFLYNLVKRGRYVQLAAIPYQPGLRDFGSHHPKYRTLTPAGIQRVKSEFAAGRIFKP